MHLFNIISLFGLIRHLLAFNASYVFLDADYDHAFVLADRDQLNLFTPVSLARPEYGVVFEHIGDIYQNVYAHYITISLSLPTFHDIPKQPILAKNFTCLAHHTASKYMASQYRDLCYMYNLHHHLMYNVTDLFIKDIYHMVHSEIPALLPNPRVPFVDNTRVPFDSESGGLYEDIQYSRTNVGGTNRQKRADRFRYHPFPYSLSDFDEFHEFVDTLRCLPFVQQARVIMEIQRFYNSSVTLDFLQEVANRPTRSKRFIAAFIRGITKVVRGANLFSKIYNGVKKIGGAIYRGLRGLFHHKRNSLMQRALSVFHKMRNRGWKLGRILKSRFFKGMHLSRLSFYKRFRTAISAFKSTEEFMKYFKAQLTRFQNPVFRYDVTHDQHNWHAMKNLWDFLTAADGQFKLTVLPDLLRIIHFHESTTRLKSALMTLNQGRLSPYVVSPKRLLKTLEMVVADVMRENPSFHPVHGHLYDFYSQTDVTFTNSQDMLLVQIPILFRNTKQPSMDLFRVVPISVPLDTDTYQRRENRFTQVRLAHQYLAMSQKEYADVESFHLDRCLRRDQSYLCASVSFTASTRSPTCAAAIFLDAPPETIKLQCQFTYFEDYNPPPQILETQDLILLANLPQGWQLVCDDQIDRPIPIPDSRYAVVRRDDLCTCGIMAGQYFVHESFAECPQSTKDTRVALYHFYNKAVTNFANIIDPVRASTALNHTPQYFLPDIQYEAQFIDGTPRYTKPLQDKKTTRTKRAAFSLLDTPSDDDPTPVLAHTFTSFTMPLDTAVSYMESGETVPANPFHDYETDEDDTETPEVLAVLDNYDNAIDVLSLINSLAILFNYILITVTYCRRQYLFNSLLLAQNTLANVPSVDGLLIHHGDTSSVPTGAPVPFVNKVPSPTPTYTVSIIVLTLLSFTILCKFIALISTLLYHCSQKIRFLAAIMFLPSTVYTDVYVDIADLKTRRSLRAYLFSFLCPPTLLTYAGTLSVQKARIVTGCVFSELWLDWESSCTLVYGTTNIPLPRKATFLTRQWNVLKSFDHTGVYAVTLSAACNHAHYVIPEQEDTPVDTLVNPISTPYSHVTQQVHSLLKTDPVPLPALV